MALVQNMYVFHLNDQSTLDWGHRVQLKLDASDLCTTNFLFFKELNWNCMHHLGFTDFSTLLATLPHKQTSGLQSI